MDTEHHPPLEISPIFICLFGILAGATMLTAYQCISVGLCSAQRQVEILTGRHQVQGNNQEDMHTSDAASEHNSMIVGQVLPVFKYNKECREGTCTVCLCEFDEGDEIRVLPECMHSFHAPCVDMWLYSHTTCPLCRTATASQQHHVALSLPDSAPTQPPDLLPV